MLIDGCNFTKHGRKGSPHKRFVWVSDNFDRIMWAESKKKHNKKDKIDSESEILFSEIIAVEGGHTTQVFQRSGKNGSGPDLSFSIITKDRTLDLEAIAKNIRDDWVKAFSLLGVLPTTTE